MNRKWGYQTKSILGPANILYQHGIYPLHHSIKNSWFSQVRDPSHQYSLQDRLKIITPQDMVLTPCGLSSAPPHKLCRQPQWWLRCWVASRGPAGSEATGHRSLIPSGARCCGSHAVLPGHHPPPPVWHAYPPPRPPAPCAICLAWIQGSCDSFLPGVTEMISDWDNFIICYVLHHIDICIIFDIPSLCT